MVIYGVRRPPVLPARTSSDLRILAVFNSVHSYPTYVGLAGVLEIPNYRSYCHHVQIVTFHPPPFDHDATFSERYRAYVREDGKVLDRRQVEDRFEDDDQ